MLTLCEGSIKCFGGGCIHQEEVPGPALVSQERLNMEFDVRPPGPDDQELSCRILSVVVVGNTRSPAGLCTVPLKLFPC